MGSRTLTVNEAKSMEQRSGGGGGGFGNRGGVEGAIAGEPMHHLTSSCATGYGVYELLVLMLKRRHGKRTARSEKVHAIMRALVWLHSRERKTDRRGVSSSRILRGGTSATDRSRLC